MRALLKTGMIVVMLTALPAMAVAGTLEGVAIGAGTGALVAGPPGAIVGGVVGAVVGGPNIVRRGNYARGQRTCWVNRDGYRRCAWR